MKTSQNSSLPTIPSFRLEGRRALVTGAGRGIGKGAAVALAEAGADVTLCGRTARELEVLASELGEAGYVASVLPLDITNLDRTSRAMRAREPFDILVNNAGTNRPMPFSRVAQADFDAVFHLNVRATFFLCQEFARALQASDRSGSIINVTSQLGHVGASQRSIYVASKFAVEGLTKALAVELGPVGIRVNAIAPTFIDTPLTQSYGLDAAALAAVRSKIKLGRIGRIEDLMGAVVYLASDASSLVTGTSLLVDGGWTAE